MSTIERVGQQILRIKGGKNGQEDVLKSPRVTRVESGVQGFVLVDDRKRQWGGGGRSRFGRHSEEKKREWGNRVLLNKSYSNLPPSKKIGNCVKRTTKRILGKE